MSTLQVKVRWYSKDKLTARLSSITDEGLYNIGLEIQKQAARNITANGQVDTGFMRASIYTVGRGGRSNYAARRAYARRHAKRDFAPEAHATDKQPVAVAAGATYAIYQEARRGFLYRACAQVTGTVSEEQLRRAARRQRSYGRSGEDA